MAKQPKTVAAANRYNNNNVDVNLSDIVTLKLGNFKLEIENENELDICVYIYIYKIGVDLGQNYFFPPFFEFINIYIAIYYY